MTILASLQDREDLGIDTIYRGFVYGSLLLALAIKDPNNPVPITENPFRNAVRISGLSNNNGTFTLQLTLPVLTLTYYDSGFNLLDSVSIVGTTDPNPYSTQSADTTTNISEIPTQPSNVTTLEDYIVWLGLNIQLAYSQLTTPDFGSMVYVYQDEALFDTNLSTLQIRHTVRYDPIIYLCTNNIIQALTQPAELQLC